ncbi:MaoC/PaaZ C-terminal domain-containing protein [Mycobacterium seoulense]|uniref:Dehydratase n=1 Tax=Mycobacterium seoulense TaxID=386911 RepID=A0A7I7P784_9MYCO|nr:MaoC/PaaZ C-terminal domain-containing protein [Mycobacterium seoulense]MCV7438768.1 MaoC family dehydratase [Mycobacterium seoulense]BBY03822.1 dehydratase [Mycobacterium seoulense]
MDEIRAYKKIADRRWRESRGLFFEDVEVGVIVEHRPGRTLTEADNVWMSLLSLNLHPLHIDNAYCEQTEWKRPLVSSLVTLSIVSGMSVPSTSAKGLANLGWDNIRLLAPVFVGDTIYAETEYLGKRLSASRAHQGIVSCATRGLKADGTLFLTCERSFLLPTREHDLEDQAAY